VIREAYDGLVEVMHKADKPLPKNDKGHNSLDCAVINTAISLRTFDSVRGAFVEGEPIYPGAALYSDTHIQICIRNPNCIKGYFRLLDSVAGFSVP